MLGLALACLAYLLTVRELFASPKLPGHILLIGLGFSVIGQLAFLRKPVGADDDIHRYVWDGHLQRLGYNPYLVVPSDPAARALHTAETRDLNNPDLTSPYPPGAQLFFRAVTSIHESIFAMRCAFVLCDFAIVLLLLDLLYRTRQPVHLILVYALNPLLAVEVAGSGHIDIVGALLLVMSAAALVRRWRTAAGLAFALAVAVKFLPIVLVPLYWKRVRVRDVIFALFAVGVMSLPFLSHGRIPTGSLNTYVETFRFNGPLFAALNKIAPARWLAGLAIVAGLVVAMCQRVRSTQWSPPEFAWPLAATLLFAPVVFPWYLLWLLPFLTSTSTVLILLWTVSIIPVYVQWHLRTLNHRWGALPAWAMVLEYGCLVIAAVLIAWRRHHFKSSNRFRIKR